MPSEQAKQIVAMLRERPVANPDATIAEMRAGFEEMTSLFSIAADVTTNAVDVAGIPGEWIDTPGAEPGRVILYVHGGGYMIGSIATHRELCSRLGRASHARVLSIDYRMAPEHQFPAAVDDAVSAYQWLLGQGINSDAVAIGGDSAGGGLAAATLVAIKDRGLPMPSAGVLLSPWTDLAATGESLRTRAGIDPMISGGEALKGMVEAYLGTTDPRTPLASPLYADLSGLPPLLIQVGTNEVLFDDATRLDGAARTAGVEVDFEAWNDMVHVFQMFASMLPEGQQAIDRIGAFVQAHTRVPVPA